LVITNVTGDSERPDGSGGEGPTGLRIADKNHLDETTAFPRECAISATPLLERRAHEQEAETWDG
jgi:hypothetical protein